MNKITIIGLGVEKNDISLSSLNAIKSAETVILKTELAISSESIKNANIKYTSLDFIYKKSRNFDTLNKNLADYVLSAAKKNDVFYLVDGSVFEDKSAEIIVKKHKNCVIIGGISKGAKALEKAGIFTTVYTAVSAYELNSLKTFTYPLVVYDIDGKLLSSDVKLKLCDMVGDEAEAIFISDGKAINCKVYELDNFEKYNYSTSVIINNYHITEKKRFNYEDLLTIVKILRSENGCPWDKVQTRESLKSNLIEESYELIDAINKQDDYAICEEIGDVLLQTAFHINFGEEEGVYTLTDVLSGICTKLISRHSHVFGLDKAIDDKSALEVWDKNKAVEKKYQSGAEYLKCVPTSFPAVMRAQKVMNRAAKYNFEFENYEQIFDKINEEINEVRMEIESGDKEKLKKECGDLLCSAVNLVRYLGFDGENCLNLTTEKFINRFERLENAVLADGKDMKKLTAKELDDYYNAVKKTENR